MRDKRERALELLRQSRDRLVLLREHFAVMPFESADDLACAQRDPRDYEPYRDFSFVVHQLDLSTEGIRQIREMGQHDVLDVLEAHVDGHVSDFIALHKHLFHTYDGIDVDELWGTVNEDVPMMVEAIDQALSDLKQAADAPESTTEVCRL
ncbi:MAG: DUF86 domain-containing protein [Eggerthellaceae bacterium]|nr:DUF86 domain-containing protein [Eggerthellaceae bacterium]